MNFAPMFAGSNRDEENCLPCKQLVVLSMLTKLRRYSTLENDVDGAPVPFRYFEVATSVQDSVLLLHWKWLEESWRLPSDSLQWSR